MGKFINLTNKKFGYLTVISRAANLISDKAVMWLCQCACGNQKIIRAKSLKNGDTRSCGCLAIKQITQLALTYNPTHLCSKKRIYSIWKNMRQRCLNPKSKHYKNYGARGINICEHWLVFENFLKDMGHPPTNEHTIERINNNENYCPENCIWILGKYQGLNRSNNRLITFNGKTKTLKEWSELTGIHRRTISSRLKNPKWTVKDSLTIKRYGKP